jgi:hypothetical protein
MGLLRLVTMTSLLLLFSNAGRAALTEDTFTIRTTGDLAALCSADPADRLYTAAVNFCHGFGAGTYGVFAAAQQADKRLKLFCPPAEITRNEAVGAFISWTRASPAHNLLPPVDGIASFLTETYPCPKAAGAAAKRRIQ